MYHCILLACVCVCVCVLFIHQSVFYGWYLGRMCSGGQCVSALWKFNSYNGMVRGTNKLV
jgi:hypothetical protein